MPANRSTRTQNEPAEVSANFSPIQRPSVRLSFGNLDESLLEVPLAARPEAPTDQSLVESSSLLLPSLIPSTAVSPPKASSLSVAADVSDLPDWASFMDNDAQMLDFFSGAALPPTDIAPGAETAASSLPSTVPIPVFPNGPSVLAPDEIPPVTMQRSFPSARRGFPSTTPANNTPQQPVSTPVSVEPYVEAPFSRLDDYKDRLTPEGVYAKLMAYFAAADLNETERSKTAAFAQFGTDFHGYAASYGDHMTYKREKEEDTHFVIFGQVAPKYEGTIFRASGNHYVGPAGKVQSMLASFNGCPDVFFPKRLRIYDHTKVKDSIVLCCPTKCPPELSALYSMQLTCFNEVFVADENAMGMKREAPYDVKECLKSRVNYPNEAATHIVMSMPAKYTGSKNINARKRIMRTDGPVPTVNQDDEQATLEAVTGSVKLKEDGVYAPKLQPDYGGNIFAHQSALLRQLPVFHADDSLVAPWRLYGELRPGTLVIAHATLHCFKYAGGGGDKRRKIFQLNAHTVKILSPSVESVVVPRRLVLPDLDPDEENMENGTQPGTFKRIKISI
ncbi:hypothetical protein C8J56DRAFT_899536 [Mycena floridula]|nr:hypothetical protein C8J56DRAFT_899536 [Mycena floridula]